MRNLLLILGLLCVATPAWAGSELNVKASLIWGCDEEKPADASLKAISPEMAKRLSGIFKWKHYFMVTNMTASVPDKGTKKMTLSKKCDVEILNKDGGKNFQAKLLGENKLLKTLDQQVKPGEDLVLAGDDKNATAWFVILTPQAK
jgi:hypothetical protein